MHKEKSAFPQSPGIRARLDYIISAHIPEVKEYTTISQELEHLQGWGLHITQHQVRCMFKVFGWLPAGSVGGVVKAPPLNQVEETWPFATPIYLAIKDSIDLPLR